MRLTGDTNLTIDILRKQATDYAEEFQESMPSVKQAG